MSYVLFVFCLVFSLNLPAKKMEKLTEGAQKVYLKTDTVGRVLRFVQDGADWAYNYDEMGRIEKVFRDKKLVVEYLRNHKEFDLIIRSTKFCYWIKRQKGRVDYGDFVSKKTGYRLLDEQNRCIYEKFMHGVGVAYTYQLNSRRITINQKIGFELSKEKVVCDFENQMSWCFEELPIEGAVLKKDETHGIEEVEILGELHRYAYDAEDQLILETLPSGKFTHQYLPGREKITSDNQRYGVEIDDLERCISLSKEGKDFSFLIDPFGRLLEINEPGKPGKKLFYENYDEIGSIEGDQLIDFRFVQHEKGFDEPKTLFIYTQGKGYKVRSDLFGNILELIEPETGVLQERIAYTAFGECQLDDSPLSPWRYRAKRWLKELELYLFNFRLYSPHKGCFLTPDPAGFDHTLNRTCYCLNNPLRFSDPKGAYIGFHLTRSQKYAVGLFLDFLGKHLPLSLAHGYKLQCFGARFMGLEQPEIFDQDHVFEINSLLGEKDTSYLFVNGISTEKPIMEHLCYDLSTMLNQKVRCVHLATQGSGRDLLNSIKEYMGIKTPGVLILEDLLQTLLEDPSRNVVIFSHSRGALATDLALKNLSLEQKKRIEIYSFGGAILIPRKTAKRVINFVSRGDPIPFLVDFKSYMFGEKYFDVDIVRLDIEEGGLPYFDHAILGSTYKTCLDNLVKEYLTQYSQK
ncbi:RHS repeat-associated core domain-containing protein [bacterium]|nr:RHS repeat-associated core domain-containing protein [bacterium]